ncbi:EAL domain-containing protein [Halioxenophilus sp. WMMB6]|uniref:EAL domain-containing protein n=1 Tax=Halioxenophilus sp. WMMB6 TaxID=3073815 RepID=UPI00295ED9E5|nr:EAL domain-containing protein [Halioxenophilus sp. WMMB6]
MVKQHLLTALVATSHALLVGALFFITLWATVADEQASLLDKRSDSVARVIDEAQSIFAALGAHHFNQCGEAEVFQMRRALLTAKFIMDIGFIADGKVHCGALPGVFNAPRTSINKPDFRMADGTDVYIERKIREPLFADIYDTTLAVSRGNIGLSLHPGRLDELFEDNRRFQFYYVNGDTRSPYTLYGNPAIFHANRHGGSKLTREGLYRDQCDSHTGLCVATELSYGEIITQNRALLVLALLSVFGGGLLSAYLFNHQISARNTVAARVRRAVGSYPFFWLYQPIVDMQSQQIIGCEVLARFADRAGFLSPADFFPELKRQKLTWAFTRQMINTVLTDLNSDTNLPDGFKVSLNICPADIESGAVRELLTMTPLVTSRFNITLEITEDEFLEHSFAKEILRELAEAGFSLSIDDFGTGYSSLAHVDNLNCNYLKIDRSFVSDIETKGLKTSLIPHIVDIANKLNLQMVAEGIETEAQYQLLLDIGVQFGQGWFFGKPMTAHNFLLAAQMQPPIGWPSASAIFHAAVQPTGPAMNGRHQLQLC